MPDFCLERYRTKSFHERKVHQIRLELKLRSSMRCRVRISSPYEPEEQNPSCLRKVRMGRRQGTQKLRRSQSHIRTSNTGFQRSALSCTKGPGPLGG